MAKTTFSQFEKYGLTWGVQTTALEIELFFIKNGGTYSRPGKSHKKYGKGIVHHMREAQKLLWPWKVWHKWADLQLECYCQYRTIVVIGAASTGKSFEAACNVLTDYYAHPFTTSVIVCSTTIANLEDRVWGEIKRLHKDAQKLHPDLPGTIIESKQRIVTDEDEDEESEGRDLRNGLVGVPCQKGDIFTGLAQFVGRKNKRVRLLADELSLLPRAFVDAISNLDKNPDFKAIGLGNPKDTTDALGVLGEPSAEAGGWEGGIDQAPGTKTWPIRRPQGICVQLPGSDSPNLDGRLGIPLINQNDIDRDIAFYGKESLFYSMMNEGRMPRGQGNRRVLTRQFCLRHRALEEPRFADNNLTRIGFLDAAYRGVGGDRCVFGELQMGYEGLGEEADQLVQAIVSQQTQQPARLQVLYLKDTMIVPIQAGNFKDPEDQIVQFVMEQCLARNIAPQHFFFDAGMRTALVSAFARLWSPAVVPIDFGGKPSQRKVSGNLDVLCCDYYSKFVTELWFSVRLVIEAQQFRGLTEDIMSEGCQREWKMVAGNKIEVESKKDMKMKTGRSPDLFDGLVCGVEGARQLGFQILNLSRKAKQSRFQTEAWKKDLQRRAVQAWRSKALSYS